MAIPCCIAPELSVSELLTDSADLGWGRAHLPLAGALRQQAMIWLPVIALAVGALLAQRFRFVVLVPATLATAVVALGVAATQTSSALSSIAIIVVTSVSMQAGYFAGMLVRRSTGGARSVPSFSQDTRREILRADVVGTSEAVGNRGSIATTIDKVRRFWSGGR